MDNTQQLDAEALSRIRFGRYWRQATTPRHPADVPLRGLLMSTTSLSSVRVDERRRAQGNRLRVVSTTRVAV